MDLFIAIFTGTHYRGDATDIRSPWRARRREVRRAHLGIEGMMLMGRPSPSGR